MNIFRCGNGFESKKCYHGFSSRIAVWNMKCKLWHEAWRSWKWWWSWSTNQNWLDGETGDSNITWQQICFIQTNVWCWTLILTIRYQISADIVRLKYYINIIQQDTLPNSSELYLLNIPDWNLFWQIKMIISQLLPLEMGI